jgi:hypothetical protein
MAAMGGDKRQMIEDAVEDKFPEGLRVLAVDDDCVCLKVLEVLLGRCKYQRESLDLSTSPWSIRIGAFLFL